MSRRRLLTLGLAAALPLAGCTAAPRPAVPPGSLRLVAFDSCDQLGTELRRAAAEAVGPWGLGGGGPELAASDVRRGGARTATGAAAPASSGTNTNEVDADEPDIVKTDGRRIVTVQHGTLRVVDAATRTRTGTLDLGVEGAETSLLLSGDHALVLVKSGFRYGGPAVDRDIVSSGPPEVLLVDLSGAPRLVSRYRGEGTLVDARQTGSVARIVLKSAPKIAFPDPGDATEQRRVELNRAAVAGAKVAAWLPQWSVTTGGVTTSGEVGCDRVSRPASYSGAALVTVLTFDLTATALTDGDPVAVAADADTVYGTGGSLYLAADQRWRLDVWPGRAAAAVPQQTEIYRFVLSSATRPAYVSSGTVPGLLVNQYAMSDWNGHLRVATTTNDTTSAVRVLTERDGELRQTGVVDGLGRGERIYSVRFIGPRGYVVTFKQTDPLYAVDLADPARPAVTGELKITGYSAHLQPVRDGRLIGVGQEAGPDGRVQGTQVSLFDVADPAQPRRLAQRHIAGGQSEAEWDPHALLYWPATRLLVVPVTRFDPADPGTSALALRVTDTGLTDLGGIAQPAAGGTAPTVRRTLVVGDVLWTLSDQGLQASDLATLDRLGWLPNA